MGWTDLPPMLDAQIRLTEHKTRQLNSLPVANLLDLCTETENSESETIQHTQQAIRDQTPGNVRVEQTLCFLRENIQKPVVSKSALKELLKPFA